MVSDWEKARQKAKEQDAARLKLLRPAPQKSVMVPALPAVSPVKSPVVTNKGGAQTGPSFASGTGTENRLLLPTGREKRPITADTLKELTGAALGQRTLGQSMEKNVQERKSYMLPTVPKKTPELPSVKQNGPTAGERLGYGAKSILKTWEATPYLLAEATKADFEAAASAERDRGGTSGTWDVDPELFGKQGNHSFFDINPDKVEQDPNRGIGKYQKPLDSDSKGMKKMAEAYALREKATEGLSGAGQFLANTGLSIASNAALLPTAAINPAIPLAAMGAQSAAQEVYEQTKEGKTAGQALSRGLIAGGIEAATEKIPLDELMSLVKVGGKSALKSILKQSGVEAGEEALSYTLNYIADKAARDPNAEFSLEELLASAAGGGLSGLFYGAGGTAVNKGTEKLQNRRQIKSGTQAKAQGTWKAATTPVAPEGQKKPVSTGEAGSNSRLSDADLQSYLTVGTREHVRNTKAEQLRNGQSPILTTVGQIRDFIKSAIEGKNRDTIKGYGKVGSKMAADIASKAKFDIGDITGYYLELDSNHLDHLSDHINDDGDPRNVPLTEEQVLSLAEYIDSYDDVLDVVRKKDGSVKVYLGKRINGHTVIVEMLSKGRGSLHPVTAWQNSTEHYIKKYGKNKTQVDTSQPSATADGESGYKPASSDLRVTYPELGVKGKNTQQGAENASPRAGLTEKAANYLNRAETALTKRLAELMSVPEGERRGSLRPALRTLSDHYLETGKLDDVMVDRVFNEAWERGRVVDDEYVRQYGDIAKELRTRAVSLSETDRSDFENYNNFRKSNFNKLNIRNEGGEPVDTVYAELSQRAPELFPASVTHPADQLRRMSEVSRLIRKTEVARAQYFGAEAADYRKMDREEFGRLIDGFKSELKRVRKYAAEQAAKEQKRKSELTFAGMDMSEEMVRMMPGIWKELKQARRNADKVKRRTLLTDKERVHVDQLLRGELTVEELPAGVNHQYVQAVYEAEKTLKELGALTTQFKKTKHAALRAEAENFLKGSEAWQDKSMGLAYSRETMERNIRDIVTDPERAEAIIQHYFEPVHKNEARRTRLKNEMRGRIRKLDLNREPTGGNAVSEAYAVQWLGEAEDNISYLRTHEKEKWRNGYTLEEWETARNTFLSENPTLNLDKIKGAIQTFREIYDELFEMMNEVRIRNGYEPVDYRRGYFPHFTADQGDGLVATFAKALGVETEITDLPTTINGLTHTFRPGTRWSGHIKQRTGFQTDYDALEGFDKYIEGISDIICHTDDIQKLRALSDQMRYRASDDEIKARVDKLRANDTLDETQKRDQIEREYQNGRYALSNFVVELEEYANLLAGKRSRRDRVVESEVGRRAYNIVKALENRVAANMVAINPASWLTNFIALTQGGAELSQKSLLNGMWDTLKAYKQDDGFAARSAFLTNRRGSDPLVRTRTQQLSADLGKGMELIDRFTADSLVRARYQENLSRGMEDQAALDEADSWTASVMADRSKGALPTLFESRNPFYKLFTQFQLEVNNQLSYLVKDLPRNVKEAEGKEHWKKQMALALLKYAVGAFLYNEVYEYFVGRRPALDPIGLLNDTAGDVTGYELPNLVEAGVGLAHGELPSLKTEKQTAARTLGNLGSGVAEELPFVGGLLGGGRLPVSSAIPDLITVKDAVANLATGEGSSQKQLENLKKEGGKIFYYTALPFGGSQVKKMGQGTQALLEGGSYALDSQGQKLLQYPVYTDPVGAVGAVAFGKTATPTGRDWVERGFKNSNAAQTETYKRLIGGGVDRKTAYETVTAVGTMEKKADQVKLLQEMAVTPEARAEVFYGVVASDKERTCIDRMGRTAEKRTAVAAALMELQRVKGTGTGQAQRQREALAQMDGLTDKEKSMLGQQILGDGRWMDYSSVEALKVSQMGKTGREQAGEAARAGIDAMTFLSAYNAQLGAEADIGLLGKTIKFSKDRNKKAAIDAATPRLNAAQRAVLYQVFDIDTQVWATLPR